MSKEKQHNRQYHALSTTVPASNVRNSDNISKNIVAIHFGLPSDFDEATESDFDEATESDFDEATEHEEARTQNPHVTSTIIEQQEINEYHGILMLETPPTPFCPRADYPDLQPITRKKKYSKDEEKYNLKIMIRLLKDRLSVEAIAYICSFTGTYADKLFRDAMREISPQNFVYAPVYDLEPVGTLISDLYVFKDPRVTHFSTKRDNDKVIIKPFYQIQSDIPFLCGKKIQNEFSKKEADVKLFEMASNLLFQGHPTLAVSLHLGISETKILNMLSKIVYQRSHPIPKYEVSTSGTRFSELKICPWISKFKFIQVTAFNNGVAIRPCNMEIANV